MTRQSVSPLSRGPRALLLAAVLAVSAFLVPSLASGDPPGNNGTVKLDRQPFDTHPNNQPHVGCVFQVDFYNYDQGAFDARVTFTIHPPSGRATTLLTDTVFIGEDPAGGGRDLDAEETYNLSSALAAHRAHSRQGYHVKLTVNAPGSQGADVKHKVFWVQPCKKKKHH